MITMALLVGVVIPSLAAGSLTTLYNVKMGGIRIVVDGDEVHPTDANGNKVQPLIYNGTSCLPVRAVASALGKAVYWDGPTYTVYLGKMDGKLDYPTVMLEDLKTISSKDLVGDSNLIDNYGNTYGSGLWPYYYNRNGKELAYEYLLDMKYSRFKATLYVPQGATSDKSDVIRIKADGKQIYSSPAMTKTSRPLQVDIDTTGCNVFEISFTSKNIPICLADAGFYQ